MEVNHTTLRKLKEEILDKVLQDTEFDDVTQEVLNINKKHIYFTTENNYLTIKSVYYDPDGYIQIELTPCEE